MGKRICVVLFVLFILCMKITAEDQPGGIKYIIPEPSTLSSVKSEHKLDTIDFYAGRTDFLGDKAVSGIVFADNRLKDIIHYVWIEDPRELYKTFNSLVREYADTCAVLKMGPFEYAFKKEGVAFAVKLDQENKYIVMFCISEGFQERMQALAQDGFNTDLVRFFNKAEYEGEFYQEGNGIKLATIDLDPRSLSFYFDAATALIEEFVNTTGIAYLADCSITLASDICKIAVADSELELPFQSRGGYAFYRIEDLSALITLLKLNDYHFYTDCANNQWTAINFYLISVITDAATERLISQYPETVKYRFNDSPKAYELHVPVHQGPGFWTALLSRLESLLGRDVVVKAIKDHVINSYDPNSQPLTKVLAALSPLAGIDLVKDWWQIIPSPDIGMLEYTLPEGTKWPQLEQQVIEYENSLLVFYTNATQMHAFGGTTPISVGFTRPESVVTLKSVELIVNTASSSDGYLTMLISDTTNELLASRSIKLNSIGSTVNFDFGNLAVPKDFIITLIIPSYLESGVTVSGELSSSNKVWLGIPGLYKCQVPEILVPFMVVTLN